MADLNQLPTPTESQVSGARSSSRAFHGPWILGPVGLVLFHLSALFAGGEESLCLAPLGLGLVLDAWLGHWLLPVLAADFFLVRMGQGTAGLCSLYEAIFLGLQIGLSWHVYGRWSGGTRRLDDPGSATIFLLLIPGVFSGLFALLAVIFFPPEGSFMGALLARWISRALGILALAPPLLSGLTTVGLELGLIRPERKRPKLIVATPGDWTPGEIIEVAGLSLAATILGILLSRYQFLGGETSWALGGLVLLVGVWASLRQGLRGGSCISGFVVLGAQSAAFFLDMANRPLIPLQGNLVAFCAVTLLVGASTGWVRASESRYRRIIGHIPLVLYSVRIPRRVPARLSGPGAPFSPHKHHFSALVAQGEITLVSPACRQIFVCEPEDLLGPFPRWLEQIFPDDREVLLAAIAELCLQKQPVTCEYRVVRPENPGINTVPARTAGASGEPVFRLFGVPMERWVRETLAPHYSPEGHLDGWEGVVEEISEQRALALDLRRTTAMLHALIQNLPTGVFFVQGPRGHPLLMNNRARQLLGQREELGASLELLPKVYRLHRPDGTLYPWENLPVARALRNGVNCMVEDIVVHRADGRHVPLISWAAPVDYSGSGRTDGAVWVLEDLDAFKQAEASWRAKENNQSLIERLPLLVFQFGGRREIQFINAQARRLLGDHSPGLESWLQRLDPQDRPAFENALDQSLKGTVARAEFKFRDQNQNQKMGYGVFQPRMQDNVVTGSLCLIVS